MSQDDSPSPESPDDRDHDPAPAIMAVVASLSLESAHVPLGAILDAARSSDPPIGPEAAAEALAGLVASGWLAEWESDDDGPGVILSAWAAERLKLRLNADSERWVSRAEYREQFKRNADVPAITEADLVRAGDTPLSQLTDSGLRERVRMRDPGPNLDDTPDEGSLGVRMGTIRGPHGREVSDRELLEIFAEAIRFTDWTRGLYNPKGGIVLHGVPAWPLPGQSRMPAGPDATYGHPPAIPSEFEVELGKGRPWHGACWACGGARLYGRSSCDVCSRGAGDGRIGRDLKLAIRASYRHGAGDGKAVDLPGDGQAGGVGGSPPGRGGGPPAETRKVRRARERGERKGA